MASHLKISEANVTATSSIHTASPKWSIVTGVILTSILWLYYSPLEAKLTQGFCIIGIVACLWLSEALDLTLTALLIPILGVLLVGQPVKDALSYFAHPIVFLFLGGFALAAALKQQGLDQRLAQHMIHLAKGNTKQACIMLSIAAAALSMWMNNTAVTAMMLPLVMGLVKSLPQQDQPAMAEFGLLGIAYSASIGGMATIVGTAPNAIAAASTNMTFTQWMMIGLPVSVILLAATLIWLNYRITPPSKHQVSLAKQRNKPLNLSQYATLLVFIAVVGFWILGGWLAPMLGVHKNWDTLIVIIGLCLLALFKLLDFKPFIRSTEWDVLLLFGGSLSLGYIIKFTGVSAFMAGQLSTLLIGLPPLLWLLFLICFVAFLTELTSNTASTALLVPLFLTIAEPLGAPPEIIATLIAIAASCAFMLPVATPPNAIVYGSGFIKQKRMMQIGLLLNLLAVVVISFAGTLWLNLGA
jgi:sodium-dependent dicarboxylate transporter 2/3/5